MKREGKFGDICIIPNPQSPIPNPQSPYNNFFLYKYLNKNKINIFYIFKLINKKLKTILIN